MASPIALAASSQRTSPASYPSPPVSNPFSPVVNTSTLSELKETLKTRFSSPKEDVSPHLQAIGSYTDTNQVSREAFVASKVGGLVKKISETSEHSPSKTLAQELMAKWKSQFSSTPAAAQAEPASKKLRVEEEEPSKEIPVSSPPPLAELLDMPSDSKRQRTVKLLKDIFKEDLPLFGEVLVSNRCVEMERELFKLSPTDFASKYRLLKTQLPKNEEVRMFLLKGDMECAELVKMSGEELMPRVEREASDKSLHNFSEAKRSDWADANRSQILSAAGVKDQTGFFKCGRCQSTKTAFYQKQTRGADEPMTVFVQCLDCKNRWKTEG